MKELNLNEGEANYISIGDTIWFDWILARLKNDFRMVEKLVHVRSNTSAHYSISGIMSQ